MRYEDASQTGSMASDVNARDDTDHLAGNDFGPATGNLITGSGTVSGATETDMVGPDGQITAITGAGYGRIMARPSPLSNRQQPLPTSASRPSATTSSSPWRGGSDADATGR